MTHDDGLYIETDDALHELCQSLANAQWLAIDTEFLREETYYPILCLIQVADNSGTVACIDPLALSSMQPFFDLLYREDILKIVHAGSQDLEIFHNLTGRIPTPLFDTQMAGPLLGYPLQAGYAALVKAELGVELDKSHTRTNWQRRPLSQQQLQYAENDVRYLGPLYLALTEKLQASNRSDWLNDDLAALGDASRLQTNPEDAWKKIRAANRLNNSALAVLQALASWREQTAKNLNVPRNRLIRDDALVDIAKIKPHDMDSFLHIRGLRENIIRKHGKRLLEIINSSKSKTAPSKPAQNKALNSRQEAIVDCLMAITKLCATKAEINPATFGNRKDMEALVRGNTDINILQGWKKHLVGDALQAFIQGKTGLSVNRQQLILQSQPK